MKYILLIYNAESAWDGQTQEQQNAEYAEYSNLSSGLREKEQLVLSEALHPIAQATSVRTREGKTMITDGPFAETKEQLAGFYLIEAADLNEAIQAAAKIPPAREGSIEVRPVRQLEP